MGRRTRLRALLLGVVALALVGAVGTAVWLTRSSGEAALDARCRVLTRDVLEVRDEAALRAAPVEDADVVIGAPSAPRGEATVGGVRRAAKAGPAREHGEAFAVAVGRTLLEAGHHLDLDALLDDVASAGFPPGRREQVLLDHCMQVDLTRETDGAVSRTLDPESPWWVRSKATGGEQEPDELRVQVLAWMPSEDWTSGDRSWLDVAFAVDVERHDDGWRVADFGWAGTALARRAPSMIAAPRGDGWCELPQR